MQITEEAFLAAINKHKGILYKVSRMYFDTLEDQQDLFQEIILQLWKSMAERGKAFAPHRNRGRGGDPWPPGRRGRGRPRRPSRPLR